MIEDFYVDKKDKNNYLFVDMWFSNGKEDIARCCCFPDGFVTHISSKDLKVKYERVKEPTNIFLNLLYKYQDLQMDIAMEELAELIQALSKARRKKDFKDNLIEEIADVEIMLDQVKLYYEIDQDAVENQKQAKIERTIERCLKDD